MCRPFFGAFISFAFHFAVLGTLWKCLEKKHVFFGAFISSAFHFAFHFAVLGTLWKCLEKNMFFFDGNRPFDSVKKTCPQMTIIVTFLDLIRSGVAQFTIGVVECLRTIKAV